MCMHLQDLLCHSVAQWLSSSVTQQLSGSVAQWLSNSVAKMEHQDFDNFFFLLLSLHSLCTIFAQSLHNLCTIFAHIFALSLHHLCTIFALSLQCLCTNFELTLHIRIYQYLVLVHIINRRRIKSLSHQYIFVKTKSQSLSSTCLKQNLIKMTDCRLSIIYLSTLIFPLTSPLPSPLPTHTELQYSIPCKQSGGGWWQAAAHSFMSWGIDWCNVVCQ